MTTIRYYATYEEREEAFYQNAASLIPRRHLGIARFWDDFSRISNTGILEADLRTKAVITSNPKDSLAFSTPRQVLTAGSMQFHTSASEAVRMLTETAEIFGLSPHLHQSVRTLSGGETVKLALARAYMAADFVRGLSVSSPFSWLSANNHRLLDNLIGRYEQSALPVDIFALEGEDSQDPVTADRIPFDWRHAPEFRLVLKKVRMKLGSPFNPLQSEPSIVTVRDLAVSLRSPCLLHGENGQGKSLFAKMLARAVSHDGYAACQTGKKPNGGARMLFQDVLTQTLLRSLDQIFSSTTMPSEKDSAARIFERLSKRVIKQSDPAQSPSSDSKDFRESLLRIKCVLAAVRLAKRPEALVLDEPDWGLAKEAATDFVLNVIEAAHRIGIPIVLISHKPWWSRVANSTVHVSRKPHTGKIDGFEIILDPDVKVLP